MWNWIWFQVQRNKYDIHIHQKETPTAQHKKQSHKECMSLCRKFLNHVRSLSVTSATVIQAQYTLANFQILVSSFRNLPPLFPDTLAFLRSNSNGTYTVPLSPHDLSSFRTVLQETSHAVWITRSLAENNLTVVLSVGSTVPGTGTQLPLLDSSKLNTAMFANTSLLNLSCNGLSDICMALSLHPILSQPFAAKSFRVQ